MSCGEREKAAKTEHTPEPLHYMPLPAADGTFMVLGGQGQDYGLVASCTTEEDARRIVACVNDFAGIPTDDLEHGDISKALKIFALDSATFRRQRDELLADVKESDALRNRLAKLLHETAIALKGEEEELQLHSWHDLPAVALAAMLEITILKQQRDELLAAAEAMVIDAEECLDFDGFTALLVPIDTYHKLMEAIASVKEK